eukprot:11415355-Prorocentrum_lima.AAC.1
MATPMMQPGVVIMATPAGQAHVPALDNAMGQETIQPVETPLSANWEYTEYPQQELRHTSTLQIHK